MLRPHLRVRARRKPGVRTLSPRRSRSPRFFFGRSGVTKLPRNQGSDGGSALSLRRASLPLPAGALSARPGLSKTNPTNETTTTMNHSSPSPAPAVRRPCLLPPARRSRRRAAPLRRGATGPCRRLRHHTAAHAWHLGCDRQLRLGRGHRPLLPDLGQLSRDRLEPLEGNRRFAAAGLHEHDQLRRQQPGRHRRLPLLQRQRPFEQPVHPPVRPAEWERRNDADRHDLELRPLRPRWEPFHHGERRVGSGEPSL